jgi:hypothetical protein
VCARREGLRSRLPLLPLCIGADVVARAAEGGGTRVGAAADPCSKGGGEERAGSLPPQLLPGARPRLLGDPGAVDPGRRIGEVAARSLGTSTAGYGQKRKVRR